MIGGYILNGKTPVPVRDLLEWAEWIGKAHRHVADDRIETARISTVFIGLDHNFSGGPPLLFETMIFDSASELDNSQWRCSTWDEAEAQHKAARKLVWRHALPVLAFNVTVLGLMMWLAYSFLSS